jgi:valyl-tRNA synthetase
VRRPSAPSIDGSSRTARATRLEKDRAAADKEVVQCRAKLDNDAFVGKAPEQVVAKIKDRLARAETDLARIAAALKALPTA